MTSINNRDEYRELLKFVETDRDNQVFSGLVSGMKRIEIAESIGISKNAVQKCINRVRRRASMRGYAPEHDMIHTTPDTHFVKGTSTLYKEGQPILQWIKTSKSEQEQLETMKEVIAALKEDITPIPPIPKSNVGWYKTDIIPWIILSDVHLGLLTHADEVGVDFDLKKAEEELCTAFKIMVNDLPDYERVVINDLGDFTHFENYAKETAASGHSLDSGCSYTQMVQTASRIMRFIINECLSKFKYVDAVFSQGNHSRVNDIWMAELIKQVYADNPRLTVLNNGNVFIPYRMGNTFVMTHHGDKCKPSQLAHVMVNDYPEDFGETHYRYIFTGHIHHKQVTKENAGITVEAFSNLTPADKYAHENGYRSGGCMTIVELSKRYGEVGRRVMPIERVQDIIADLKGNPSNFMDTKRKEVHTVH